MKSFLETLGLSQNEIKIYQAALDCGESSVTDLSKRARVHRVAAYALIDGLIKKGLLSQTSVKHGKLISAKHPRELRTLIKREQRELKKLELKYEELLPEMASMYSHSGVRARVQFYEGQEGLEQLNQDIIDTVKDLPEDERMTFSYSNPNRVDEVFEGYVFETDGYVDQRRTYGIWNTVIALDGSVTKKLVKKNEEDLREMIVLSEKYFPFTNDITIYANKVAIQALQHERIGVVIESQEIAQDQKAIFQLAWLGAQTL